MGRFFSEFSGMLTILGTEVANSVTYMKGRKNLMKKYHMMAEDICLRVMCFAECFYSQLMEDPI
jgi:hypothetical protein